MISLKFFNRLKKGIHLVASVRGRPYQLSMFKAYRTKAIANQIKYRDAEYRLTVFIPAYNAEATIAKAIESVLSQDVGFRFKIIILNDASTDRTAEIANDFCHQYSDVVFAHHGSKNRGLPHNHFHGLTTMTETEYFAVLDSDDYYTNTRKLHMQVEALDKHLECSYSSHAVIWKDGSNDRNVPDALGTKIYTKYFYCHTSTKVYRSTILDFIANKNPVLVIDYPIARISSLMGKNYYFNEAMSVYEYNHQGIWSSLKQQEQCRRNIIIRTVLYYYSKGAFVDGKIDRKLLSSGQIDTVSPYEPRQD